MKKIALVVIFLIISNCSTVKNKTDNVVDDFKENKLLEKTTDEEGNPKELSEYEQIIAERESIEETIAELEKELEDISLKGNLKQGYAEINSLTKLEPSLNMYRDIKLEYSSRDNFEQGTELYLSFKSKIS